MGDANTPPPPSPRQKKKTTWRGGVQRMPPSRSHTRCGELTSPRRLQQQGRRNSSHAFVQLPLFHWSKLDNLVQNPPPRTIIIQIKCDPNARTLQSLSLSLSLSLSSLCVWVKMGVVGVFGVKGETAYWTEFMACKRLWLGLQCGKGKRPPGQKWWPAIQGAVVGFSV